MAPFKRYEQLSELVKMYPCLHNKQEKDFKNEEVKQRAWNEIAKELDLENGTVVEQLWKSVKSVLTQKRLFSFLFFSWRLLHRRRNKANDSRSSKRRLLAISLFSRKNFFF